MASSDGTSGTDSALLSKLGGAFFGGSNSPQKVIANVRGILANRLTGALPDTGKPKLSSKKKKETESAKVCRSIFVASKFKIPNHAIDTRIDTFAQRFK